MKSPLHLQNIPSITHSSKWSEILLSSPSVKDAYFLGVVSVIPLEMKAGNIPCHQTEGYHPPRFQMQGTEIFIEVFCPYHILNNTVISPLPCFVAILMEEIFQTF